MSNLEGFTPIVGVFFAAFHPHEGTKILYQVPEDVVNIDTSFNEILTEGISSKKSRVNIGTHESEDDRLSTDFGNMSILEQRRGFVSNDGNEHYKLINFDDIKNHVIPKPEFCNRLLSVKAGKYRVIGYPVNIQESFYARNSFNFNFCFIFEYDKDSTFYEPVVRRLGRMFKVLEEQLQILSKSSNDLVYFNIENQDIKDYISRRDLNNKYYKILNAFRPQIEGVTTDAENIDSIVGINDNTTTLQNIAEQEDKNAEFSIENMIQQIYQDLNNYSECSIKINAGNSIDIKLFPSIKLPDVNIQPCDVPISTINLNSLIDFYWDPNLLRVSQHIDGVNNIFKISKLCNADYLYTCSCVKHLMAYKCIILLDTFSFQNIYATSSEISLFAEHKLLGEECKRYIYNGKNTNPLRNLPFTMLETSNSFARRNGSFASVDNNSMIMETGSAKSLETVNTHSAEARPIGEKERSILIDRSKTNNTNQGEQSNLNSIIESVNSSSARLLNKLKKSINAERTTEPKSNIDGTAKGAADSDPNLNGNQQINNQQSRSANTNGYSYDSNKNPKNGYISDSLDSFNQSGSTSDNFYGKGFHPLSTIQLFQLYLKFKQGTSVEKWYLENESLLRDLDIDIRRFVTYGLLQGILYRIYSYPMLVEFNSKWLSKCQVFYLEKNEEATKKLNIKLSSGNDPDSYKELLKDQEFREKYNSKNNLKPLTVREIDAKNYHLVQYRTTIFPKPGTHRDITTAAKKSRNLNANESHFNSASMHGSSINFTSNNQTSGHDYVANKISLQKFKNPKYIKVIKGHNHDQYYSLTSILTLKKEYLDKIKHFDLICTEFDASKKEVEKVLKSFWKYHVVQR